VRRFERTRSGSFGDVNRQRLAGFALSIRLNDGDGRYALGQELAGGAVVVMMVRGVMVRGRDGRVGRGMLGVASMMMPAVRNMLGRGFVLVVMVVQ
jgi:hypothetical protein